MSDGQVVCLNCQSVFVFVKSFHFSYELERNYLKIITKIRYFFTNLHSVLTKCYIYICAFVIVALTIVSDFEILNVDLECEEMGVHVPNFVHQ